MMAKKDRFYPGFSASFAPNYESEGSDSSGRIDSADDTLAPTRKWINLNSSSKEGFAVPIQTIPLSKLSSFERKNIALRLTSELDQIKFLQNKVESQKRKPINAVAMSSSNDVASRLGVQQNGSQFGGIRKPSEVGSAPGKKGRGGPNRGIAGKFESVSIVGLLKQCQSLLKKLMAHQYAWVFNTPVDVVTLNIPDYFDVIKTPMDLGTIKRNLASGKYLTPMEFLADVRLTFTNAKTYNPPGTDVHVMAETMSQFFESSCKTIEKKLLTNIPESLPEKSGNLKGTETAKGMAHFKKRKLSPTLQEAKQEPAKRKMTDEEKHKISTELEELMGDLPDPLINFLRTHCSNGGDGADDEIEIDIDDLSDDVLFTLRKLLDDHLQEKKKNLKSEACEIELPNSGFSNSSLQVDRGNDGVDEDVDIGGNEAPVTSYLPPVIRKDAGGKAEERTEAGPDSDRGSECSKNSSAFKQGQVDVGRIIDSNDKADVDEIVDGHAYDQLDEDSKLKSCTTDSDIQLDGDTAAADAQVSPDKRYRAAILKNRFLDTILKAREKTLVQDEKVDPEKARREREELEMQKKREKARLLAEAKAAEEARKRAEAEAAAEAKKKRDLEREAAREAAREALLKMEKTVEIENPQFLEDLEMMRAVPAEQLPSSVDETSPEQSSLDRFGSFKFGGSNPLEQLGLYMKEDEDEEDAEPPNEIPSPSHDVEEGEID